MTRDAAGPAGREPCDQPGDTCCYPPYVLCHGHDTDLHLRASMQRTALDAIPQLNSHGHYPTFSSLRFSRRLLAALPNATATGGTGNHRNSDPLR